MVIFTFLALAAFVVLPVVTWFIRTRVTKRDRIINPLCCVRCGYNLSGLSIPRCPECGAAVGFDKTFSELGVDEAEVIRHTDRRRSELTQSEVSDQSEPL